MEIDNVFSANKRGVYLPISGEVSAWLALANWLTIEQLGKLSE